MAHRARALGRRTERCSWIRRLGVGGSRWRSGSGRAGPRVRERGGRRPLCETRPEVAPRQSWVCREGLAAWGDVSATSLLSRIGSQGKLARLQTQGMGVKSIGRAGFTQKGGVNHGGGTQLHPRVRPADPTWAWAAASEGCSSDQGSGWQQCSVRLSWAFQRGQGGGRCVQPTTCGPSLTYRRPHALLDPGATLRKTFGAPSALSWQANGARGAGQDRSVATGRRY